MAPARFWQGIGSMTRWIALGALGSLLVACGNDAGPQSPFFRGDVDVRSCSGSEKAPLLDDGEANPRRVIAAICGDLQQDNTLTVSNGSLAVDGHSRIASPLNVVNGSFTGFAGIEADNTHDVAGDLATAGDWVVHSPAHVGGDARIGGQLSATNTVDVDGTLWSTGTVPERVSAGHVSSSPGPIANPLDCANARSVSDLIDGALAPGFVDFGPALSKVPARTDVRLGCDRYRFASWGVEQPLTVRVSGATVVVVDGDVRIASPLRIEVEPNASLQLLIRGSLEVDNTLVITGRSTWLGVGGDLRVASPMELTGVLYAPHAAVGLDNTLEVTGALCVGALRVAAPLTVNALPETGVRLTDCVTPD